MEEVGPQVVSPMLIHRSLSARFHDPYVISKKRGLPLHPSSYVREDDSRGWNPKSWNWDSSRFVAKPLHCEANSAPREEHATLGLQLGGGGNDNENENGKSSGENGGLSLVGGLQPVSRPNKRVRSGSPSGPNYPMCQVDDCKEDLSRAKDYHRRHKVCEVHSKAGNALVRKQMQRFCQQCSRFHLLSEFDEGKRSCRRRLAGHNRRRRKTQPEENNPSLLVPSSCDNNVTNNDIINLLTVLSCAQGNTEEANSKSSSIPSKDQLINILSKINSLPLPEDLAAKLNATVPNHISSETRKQNNGTMDLLAIFSKTSKAPSHEILPRPSTGDSNSEKTKSHCVDQEIDFHAGQASPSLHLQLFCPYPEDYRSMKLPPDGNVISSGSSNPSVEVSPMSSPPVVHDLFPMWNSSETVKDTHLSKSEGETARAKSTTSNGGTSLQLFGSSIIPTENGSNQSSPYQAGYTSSGSDHSPSSLNSDSQDRTGRIIFKLFDKDPSHLPGSLRTQLYNWLSNSPSEMESYIRPGCIVLSLYLSMPSPAWDHLEGNLLNYVKCLVKTIDVDFWGNGRFLAYTDRQMVLHKEGKLRLCKTWRAWCTPELISVSPLAVVAGHETSLVLHGRNLMGPATMVHCTHAAEFKIKEAPLTSYQDTTAHDEISLVGFRVNSSSGVLGRFFIEVENKSRTTSFPVIIADKAICQELRLLESEINGTTNLQILHFLNELGWLFQRKHNSFLFGIPDYRLSRFKFLLIFSVEHDFCALVKTLLGILVELNVGREGLVRKSLEMLSEIHLLSRAVKRRCRAMVDLLINYSVIDSADSSKNFIFVPDMAGPGGITPLHLAACTSFSDDIVDALTNDTKEVGLRSWNSVVDANGLSPYAYASMRNNHSYNALVARKLAEKENGQISVSIKDEIEPLRVESDPENNNLQFNKRQKSCSRCAVIASRGCIKKFGAGSKGLLQRPYIHSMLVVAAVCVCVCLLMRSHPRFGCGKSVDWDRLQFGTM
ncbi:Squamosa promoter-binding-like protein 14 [Striga hermonthica]|uniref:Squamosa promoter-binding-like protein 14 n=1 Tax=Striga hermonthica TaxID=68872 RepID=A0A9N7RDG4_STRHE|nr:Squamosa promoter-binding-like protein 14 [Striga hermonthica]